MAVAARCKHQNLAQAALLFDDLVSVQALEIPHFIRNDIKALRSILERRSTGRQQVFPSVSGSLPSLYSTAVSCTRRR